MRYRRADIEGACYFFTVNLAERKQSLLIDHVDLLREAFTHVKQSHRHFARTFTHHLDITTP